MPRAGFVESTSAVSIGGKNSWLRGVIDEISSEEFFKDFKVSFPLNLFSVAANHCDGFFYRHEFSFVNMPRYVSESSPFGER